MRKVKFKDFIPAEYSTLDEDTEYGRKGTRQLVKGTNQYQKEFDTIGYFHKWGVLPEYREDGYINFNVALIEREDGTMAEVRVDKLKFID